MYLIRGFKRKPSAKLLRKQRLSSGSCQTLPIAQASHQGDSSESPERLMFFDSNFFRSVRGVTTKSKNPQKMQKPPNATISEELTEVELLTPKFQSFCR